MCARTHCAYTLCNAMQQLTAAPSPFPAVDGLHYKVYYDYEPFKLAKQVSPWQWVSVCFFMGETTQLTVDGEVAREMETGKKGKLDLTVWFGGWCGGCDGVVALN